MLNALIRRDKTALKIPRCLPPAGARGLPGGRRPGAGGLPGSSRTPCPLSGFEPPSGASGAERAGVQAGNGLVCRQGAAGIGWGWRVGSCRWSSPARAAFPGSSQSGESSGSPACTLPAGTGTGEPAAQPYGTCQASACSCLPRRSGTSAAWGRSANSVPPVSRPSSAPRWLPRQVGASCPPLRSPRGPCPPSRRGGARGSGSIWLLLTAAQRVLSVLPSPSPACHRPPQARAPASAEPWQSGCALGCLVWHCPAPVLGATLGRGARGPVAVARRCTQPGAAVACPAPAPRPPALPWAMCERSATLAAASACGRKGSSGWHSPNRNLCRAAQRLLRWSCHHGLAPLMSCCCLRVPAPSEGLRVAVLWGMRVRDLLQPALHPAGS